MSLKKILTIIFISLFTITYAIFNGDAFLMLVKYKYHAFIKSFAYEMRRPLNLNFFSSVTSLPEGTLSTILSLGYRLPQLPQEALTQNILELPEFNILAPILEPEKITLQEIYKLLRQGVVLFPGSTKPGGDYGIIIGHSSSYPWTPGRYKSVFSLLNELSIGDTFNVYYNQKPLVYKVTDKKVFLPWPKGNDSTETIFPPETGKKILILQSCWPVGVNYKRVAVKAELIAE